jgi:hypothetical protein
VRSQLGKGDKNNIRDIYNGAAYWGDRVRLMQHWSDRLAACVTVRPPSRCADRRPSWLSFRASAAKRDIHPRSVIFIHAVEVDHGLASHLVGPDPLVGDQLISLSLSELAIAATVLELDEPAPLMKNPSNLNWLLGFFLASESTPTISIT